MENQTPTPQASVPAQKEQENALALANQQSSMLVFGSQQNFETAQRMAKLLAASKIIPVNFQNSIPDCMIALEMSNRIGASPIMVMQNMCVVHGNPSFSAKFLIATLNSCGRFSPLRYKEFGQKGTDSYGCFAYAVELNTGEVLEGPEVTIKMAKDEGWYQKNGSKWQTMPQLMLHYRAAAFFQRTYAPEISMGLLTQEEAYDMSDGKIISGKPSRFSGASAGIAERLQELNEQEAQVVEENGDQQNAGNGTLFN